MCQQHVIACADTLSNPSERSIVYPLGTSEIDETVFRDVRGADMRCAIRDKFVTSWSVLAMVAVLNQENTGALQLADGLGSPVRPHNPPWPGPS